MVDNTCVIAMDIGGTFIKSALVRQNRFVENSFRQIPVDSDGSWRQCRDAYMQAVSLMGEIAENSRLRIEGVGISVPGPFDYRNGISMMDHKFSAIRGMSMKPWFTEKLGDVPIRFVSDSAAYLGGQMMRKKLEGYTRVCLITLGTGVGLAASIDGEILSTETGAPRIVIFDQPYRENTVEYYVARKGIIRRYHEIAGNVSENLDVIDIARLAGQGESAAQQVFIDEGVMLSEILDPVIQEYGFQALIVGGQIARSFHLFSGILERNLYSSSNLELITAATHLDTSALLGAAYTLRSDTE